MRLSISGIAWDTAEDPAVARLLKHYGIDAIDIAPGKYFSNPHEASTSEIEAVRKWWADQGIEITGMQALLFGTTGLNLFGGTDAREAMLRHLAAICRVGGVLGATRLVFGSPRNRDRGDLDDETVRRIAGDFFRRLGDIAAANGVMMCLEPNPPCYGANFMKTSSETAKVVEGIQHPAIRMQLDTGAMTINEEDPESTVSSYASLIGHIHASEPSLLPLGDGGTEHGEFFPSLSRYLPQHVVSIEMTATQNEPHLHSMERAIQVAIREYRK